MENNEPNVQQMNDDEIDFANLLRQIWAGRGTILITIGVFLVMAVIYLLYNSYSGSKEYESKVTLIVESPSPDSLITVTKSPQFISEVLKIRLTGLKPGTALTVAEVLNQQTKPPQGNLAGLTNRINAAKGDAGILVITVNMQDQPLATQLADSIVQKLIQFLKETQIKRAVKNQELLAADTSRKFQLIRETASRNLQYLSKGTSKNIEFLNEGIAKNIQYKNDGSAKEIQFLTEGYHKAESDYLQSQQALTEYYKGSSKKPESIDSLEVKRINADIKLKYNVYSILYQQLESITINTKKQYEQVKIDAEKELQFAKLDANEKLEQAKLDAEKQLQQVIIDTKNQIEQVSIDAVKKAPEIKVLEPATSATQVNTLRIKKIVMVMGFLGIILGIGIVFGKKFWDKNIRKKNLKYNGNS